MESKEGPKKEYGPKLVAFVDCDVNGFVDFQTNNVVSLDRLLKYFLLLKTSQILCSKHQMLQTTIITPFYLSCHCQICLRIIQIQRKRVAESKAVTSTCLIVQSLVDRLVGVLSKRRSKSLRSKTATTLSKPFGDTPTRLSGSFSASRSLQQVSSMCCCQKS